MSKWETFYAHHRYSGGFTFSSNAGDPLEVLRDAYRAQQGVYYSTPSNQLQPIDRITVLSTGETEWERE